MWVISGKTVSTHWGRETHTPVNKSIIGSDNGLSPIRCQAIIRTNVAILLIGNKFQWNLDNNMKIFIQENAFENGVCKMAAILYQPQCVTAADILATHQHSLYWLLMTWLCKEPGHQQPYYLSIPIIFWAFAARADVCWNVIRLTFHNDGNLMEEI